MGQSRRGFIRTVALGLGAPLIGCQGRVDDAVDTGDPQVPLVPIDVSLWPWSQWVAPGQLRVRVETREAIDLLCSASGGVQDEPMARTEHDLAYTWDADGTTGPEGHVPDEPGIRYQHEVILSVPEDGTRTLLELHAEGREPLTLSVRTPMSSGDPVRVVWVSDTMFPISSDVAAVMEDIADVDLVIHGGDLQYQTNPYDTWRGMNEVFRTCLQRAPFMTAVGNHEKEEQDELTVMFDRLYGDQGGPAATRYFSTRCGPIDLIILDTETAGESLVEGSAQGTWLIETLQTAIAEGRVPVLGFHRPVYTLSKHAPDDMNVRDFIHGLCLNYGVRLVLQGHAHCYERFVVDGVHYIVDGGGGAFSYSPDVEAEARPDELALRVVAERTYGCTVIEMDSSGQLSIYRPNTDGGLTDQFTL